LLAQARVEGHLAVSNAAFAAGDAASGRAALAAAAAAAVAAPAAWRAAVRAAGADTDASSMLSSQRAALLAAARQHGVSVLDGARCCGAGGGADLPLTGGAADTRQHVRLCFAFLEEAELREGVARLEAALTDARAAKRRLSPL
jgi:DNA-binding transcriptional MocR family regulator